MKSGKNNWWQFQAKSLVVLWFNFWKKFCSSDGHLDRVWLFLDQFAAFRVLKDSSSVLGHFLEEGDAKASKRTGNVESDIEATEWTEYRKFSVLAVQASSAISSGEQIFAWYKSSYMFRLTGSCKARAMLCMTWSFHSFTINCFYRN